MVALEGDMPAHRLEEPAQHVAERLHVYVAAAGPDMEQLLGDIVGIAFVREVLEGQPIDRGREFARGMENLPQRRKQRLLLIGMHVANQPAEALCGEQAVLVDDIRRQRVGDRLKVVAERELQPVRFLPPGDRFPPAAGVLAAAGFVALWFMRRVS